ncbi:UDP-glycosyltransferase 79B30-like [Chenopodium quinoa]|uniref:Glycosyltransferase n=1 Tax=Chenopodium quinoa TaxID=63459 RepID=A0A803LQI8_CHEQI|nr:UDP-glycosyltransferase 79B30-like [Chenopodium quinoa]
MSKINETNECLHIAMYPWFAFGHLTYFLHLANKFAQRGHKISFFLPTKTQPKLSIHNHHPNLITFIPINVPHVDGLPFGAETTNDVSSSSYPLIMDAMNLTRPDIDSKLGLLKPDFIFFDFTEWLPDMARKHSVKSVYYSTMYAVSFAYLSPMARKLPPKYCFKEADLVEPPPGFPCSAITLRPREARELAYICSIEFGGVPLLQKNATSFRECDVVGSKTSWEMEGPYCDFIKKQINKPVLLTGPMVPEPPSSKLDDSLDCWLKGFGHGRVLYCALGSECVLKMDQFQELVLGLELTGRPFLAALRPPSGCETIEQALPEGYMEKVKGRGIIHSGWVQQQLILHHPSVGCFVTHCGAGSLSEAILSECQLVLIPQAVDQFVNARMMSLDLKVGVEVDKGEDDGFFTKQTVFEAIEMVMKPESVVGKEVRDNHTKLRNLLSKEGLEDSYIDKFVQSLQDLV